jgi:hypothetical protein
MQGSEWDFEGRMDDDPHDVAWPGSAEERVDRFGMRTALLLLAIGLFIAAIWVISLPSFEKCSVTENATERHACYDKIRDELLKPPAR